MLYFPCTRPLLCQGFFNTKVKPQCTCVFNPSYFCLYFSDEDLLTGVILKEYNITGCEINFFFSESHLAPKFFKVVANSKKVGRHFQRQTRPFFTLSAF